jgi:hypothetical protein
VRGAGVIRSAQAVLDTTRYPEHGPHRRITLETAGREQHASAGADTDCFTAAPGHRSDHRTTGDDEVDKFGIAVQGDVRESAQGGEEPADQGAATFCPSMTF